MGRTVWQFSKRIFSTPAGALLCVEKYIQKLQDMHGIWRSSRPTVLYNVASLTAGKKQTLKFVVNADCVIKLPTQSLCMVS